MEVESEAIANKGHYRDGRCPRQNVPAKFAFVDNKLCLRWRFAPTFMPQTGFGRFN